MSNIHGLSSLKGNNPNSRDDSSDSNDEEHRQGFYVGGSDHSGQQVLGPPDAPGSGSNDVATRLFDAARHAGAEHISPEELNAANQAYSSGGGGVTFSGGTYRLGGHGQPSESILKPSAHEDDTPRGSTVSVNFNVWEDGFSIDDGPLRGFNEPGSRPFLESIARGQIPTELVQQHPGRKVDFHMIRKNTPYVAPKAKPFSGQGYRLGSIVPNVVGGGGLSETLELVELEKPSDEELAELLKTAQEAVGLRDGAPTTRVQVRLPAGGGGRPMVGTFNHDHTVMDLRTFIVNAQPNLAFQPFQLLTLYPTKIIENESDTLKEAGLLNSVVNVKYV